MEARLSDTPPKQLSSGLHRANKKARQISDERREKKRVADRLCQRQARARKKDKIAELESLVTHLTSLSGNEVYRELREQLEETRTECKSLKQKLATILSIAQINGDRTSDVQHDPGQDSHVDFSPEFATSVRDKSPAIDFEASNQPGNQEGSVYASQEGAEFGFANTDTPQLDYFDGIYDEAALLLTVPPQSDVMNAFHFDTSSAASIKLSFPESELSCNCVDQTQPESPNLWSSMSETLMGWKTHTCHEIKGGETHDDIAVRAVTEGWKDPHLGKLSASWRILRQVDQKVWAESRPVDRLAVLSIMNMLLQCHLNPSEENLSKLPPWYRPRPSQMAQKHPYAVDFFVWPGIRERFIYHQHKYCSDHFWSLLAQHFRFDWPYDLRDCYVHNRSTGRYELSGLFRRHLDDLSSFTLCKDMFNQFPEFECDIPSYMAIPRELDPSPQIKKYGVESHQRADKKNQPGERRSGECIPVPLTGMQSQWQHFPYEDIMASVFQNSFPAPLPAKQPF